ncbi:hypothetical protein DL240_02025 [Lujinxingia litoralis]|uniref:Uncharacterized protein n=1 Tax=Lujinxingia litoralis TaxID=2211119 RepID=A0A328CDY7_9DELT|nr:hypothetical protein [Lujinxingia litoralis]RAL25013.1 hypothetical protein DL240_02025 [Lujinxingia litoralis]
MKNISAQRTAINLAKTAAAGAMIAALAWAVGVFDIDGSVQDSHADLLDLRPLSTIDPVESFARELAELGHPEPRTYELNGNTIYFSVRKTDAPPLQVLQTYQRQFKKARLNDQIYLNLQQDQSEARMITALTGGLVPHSVEPNHVTMGGLITRGRARNADDIRRDFVNAPDPNLLFRGHRWIEAFREPHHEQTTVIASWSDDAFLYGRMLPTEMRVGYGAGADDVVPACPGCVRLNRMRDLSGDKHQFLFEGNVYTTNHSPEQIIDFYQRALTARGWTAHENNNVFYDVQIAVDFEGRQTDVLAFKRDDRFIKLVIYRQEGKTYVHSSMTPEAEPN